MYKDEKFEFSDLSTMEVCVELRRMLSEAEDNLDGYKTIPFDAYREGLRISALKIAFEHYRTMMLKEVENV